MNIQIRKNIKQNKKREKREEKKYQKKKNKKQKIEIDKKHLNRYNKYESCKTHN